ncbi:MAG: hypothetical protein ACTSQK_10435 [Candidatus Heimdallarchaeota archaeon]
MKNDQGSDLGFILFLIFAGIMLIPLYFGVKDITELTRIGKIILIIVVVLAVIISGVIGGFYFRRKIKNSNRKNSKEKTKNKKEENLSKLHFKENENVSIVRPTEEDEGFLLENDEIIGETIEEIIQINNHKETEEDRDLENLNRKFKT